jgi:hypothetical protein
MPLCRDLYDAPLGALKIDYILYTYWRDIMRKQPVNTLNLPTSLIRLSQLFKLSAALLVSGSLGLGVAVAIPNPTVSGPVTCGACSQASGLPEMSATIQPYLAAAGYEEKEYFISGNATAYTTTAPLTSDGKWNNIVPNSSAAYKTRILVRRPIDPKQFNGTVIVEWFNVTAGYDADWVWTMIYPEVLRSGYAYVDVSAQAVGVNALPIYDALRYGSLSHPGDSYSYDIFSQAAQAIEYPVGINPLEGLEIKRVLATGNSQAAHRLTTYINAVQKTDQAFDGFLISSRIYFNGATDLAQSPQTAVPVPFPLNFRTDLGVPVLHTVTESDPLDGTLAPPFYYGGAQQADNSLLRVWEIAGTAHLSQWELTNLGARPAIGLNGPLTCVQPITDGLAHRYVLDAALAGLNNWVATGTPVKSAPRFSIASATFPLPPVVNRDSYGNILGGIRTPFVDVPIASYTGLGNTNSPASPGSFLGCVLAGIQYPLDSTTMNTLYPNHGRYVSQVAQSVKEAVKAGYLLRDDTQEILNNAVTSTVGKP